MVLVVLESCYTQSQAVEVNEQAVDCCIVPVLVLKPFPEAVWVVVVARTAENAEVVEVHHQHDYEVHILDPAVAGY